MGHKNRKFVLGILLAGLNRYIERGWRAKQVANQEPRAAKTRAKRRQGTYSHLWNASEPTDPAPASRAKVTQLRT